MIEVTGPKILFSFSFFGLFDVTITETVLSSFLVMLTLVILSICLGRNLKKRPGRRQVLVEKVVQMLYNMVRDTMGEKYRKYTPYIGGLFCFSILSSLMGLFGFRCPTSDLSVIAAWGITTFVLTLRNKLKTGGIKGYLKGFIEPMPFMLPFNIIGDIANPVSQTLRHFANILAGSVIGGLIYFALGQVANGLASIGIPAICSLYFDLFSAFIQAYIFCTLTMAYVSMAECGED